MTGKFTCSKKIFPATDLDWSGDEWDYLRNNRRRFQGDEESHVAAGPRLSQKEETAPRTGLVREMMEPEGRSPCWPAESLAPVRELIRGRGWVDNGSRRRRRPVQIVHGGQMPCTREFRREVESRRAERWRRGVLSWDDLISSDDSTIIWWLIVVSCFFY